MLGLTRSAGLFAALFFVAAQAQAGIIYLKNGDQITGEITDIWDNEVTIEPDYADDEFKVDLAAVAYMETDLEFDIELADGREVTGKLAGGSEEQGQLIDVDGEIIAISYDELFQLEEIEDYFDNENHIDFSADIDKGNTDQENYRLRGDTFWKFGDHRHFADASFIREETDGEDTKEQDLIRYNYNWLFADPWYFGLSASYERDPIKELDSRYIGAATVGRDIFNTPDLFWTVQSGFGYQKEEIGDDNEDQALWYWDLKYKQEIVEDFNIFHNHNFYTTLSGRDNSVFKSSTGLNYEITDLLYANIEYLFDWESDPAAGNEKDDTSLMLGLGVEF